MAPENRMPTHPGVILSQEFLAPHTSGSTSRLRTIWHAIEPPGLSNLWR